MPKPCRYLEHLEGKPFCAYWQEFLLDNEDIRCYTGGWECFEEDVPRTCLYDGSNGGMWLGLEEAQVLWKTRLPPGLERASWHITGDAILELFSWPEYWEGKW